MTVETLVMALLLKPQLRRMVVANRNQWTAVGVIGVTGRVASMVQHRHLVHAALHATLWQVERLALVNLRRQSRALQKNLQ
jgi:hypothetical protein